MSTKTVTGASLFTKEPIVVEPGRIEWARHPIGHIVRTGIARWNVKGNSGVYVVEWDQHAHMITCTCPRFHYLRRGEWCRHIQDVVARNRLAHYQYHQEQEEAHRERLRARLREEEGAQNAVHTVQVALSSDLRLEDFFRERGDAQTRR